MNLRITGISMIEFHYMPKWYHLIWARDMHYEILKFLAAPPESLSVDTLESNVLKTAKVRGRWLMMLRLLLRL